MKSLLQARSLHSPACEILAERVGRSIRERVLPPVWTSGPLRSWPAAEGRGGGGSADNEFFLRSYDFIQTIKGQIQISNRLFFLFLVKKRLPPGLTNVGHTTSTLRQQNVRSNSPFPPLSLSSAPFFLTERSEPFAVSCCLFLFGNVLTIQNCFRAFVLPDLSERRVHFCSLANSLYCSRGWPPVLTRPLQTQRISFLIKQTFKKHGSR